jgi:hypothetical protein
MLVVSEQGVHQTSDAGKSWTLTLPREELPGPVKNADFGLLMPCFAWDATRDILYATSAGEHLYKGAR